MTTATDLATALTLRRPDRYAEVRDETAAHVAQHECDLVPLSPLDGRALGVLVRATHSSYVLELGTGLGYPGLHIAAAFGQTGRLDTVEADPSHAALAEANFRRFTLDSRIRIHHGRATEVVPALNGPYDLLVLGCGGADYAALFDEFARLLRVGGSVFVRAQGGIEVLPEAFLERLATDDRFLPSFAPGIETILATRTR